MTVYILHSIHYQYKSAWALAEVLQRAGQVTHVEFGQSCGQMGWEVWSRELAQSDIPDADYEGA